MKKICAFFFAITLISSSVFADSWYDNIKVKGDLRIRREISEKENEASRDRRRIRARLSIAGKAAENIKIEFRLATGSGDPISTNQTMSDGFSSKNIVWDLAYAKYTGKNDPDFSAIIGKFKNPFFTPGKSELIWDGDLNPEGSVLKYTHDFSNFSPEIIIASMWVEEREKDKDSYMISGQGILHSYFKKKKFHMALGGGYFRYFNTRGYQPFYNNEKSFGNSVVPEISRTDTSIVYANEYELMELSAEFTFRNDRLPITIMYDYVKNLRADELNQGWLAGIGVGKAGKETRWSARYNYRRLENDAVVGIFTDSDFGGGGTDAKGHEIGGSYWVANNTFFNLTYFSNDIGLYNNSKEYAKLQMDIQFKFN